MSEAPAEDAEDPLLHPLAHLHGDPPPAAEWMTRALATAPERLTTEVDGAGIEVLRWGERSRPPLMLVHGGVAHARWWDFVAPYLADGFNVAAVTLSGQGDSGWRDQYGLDLFAREVEAAGRAAGLYNGDRLPLLIGHSFGGIVSAYALQTLPDRFGPAILVDSPLIPFERRLQQQRKTGRRHRPCPDLVSALARFRLAPPEPPEELFILDHVARAAIGRSPEGFTWKFDPDLWGKLDPHRGHPDFAALQGRLAFVHGGRSQVVGPDTLKQWRDLLGPDAPFVQIPEAHHHLMLSHPLAFVAAVNALLAAWPPARAALG